MTTMGPATAPASVPGEILILPFVLSSPFTGTAVPLWLGRAVLLVVLTVTVSASCDRALVNVDCHVVVRVVVWTEAVKVAVYSEVITV